MSRPKSFSGVEKLATVGCWRLEEDTKKRLVQPIPRQLTRAILVLAARVPDEAQRTTSVLYDINAVFDDSSRMLFSLKPYSSDHYRSEPQGQHPRRRDEIDLRFFGAPFRDDRGSSVRMVTIVRSEDFRMERTNELIGGRKIMPVRVDDALPDWQELDWDNVETMCPIQADNMTPWLTRLDAHLNRSLVEDFEKMATETSLYV